MVRFKLLNQLVAALIVLGGYASMSSAGCHEARDIRISTSVSNFSAAKLDFPHGTTLAIVSKIPAVGKVTAFEHEYLQAVARAAGTAGRDLSRVVVPILPYASFEPSIYSEASSRYPAPISVLIDPEEKELLLVSLSPARLLALVGAGSLACGSPLVLNADKLNDLAGKWARDVLPSARKRKIKRFSTGLPEHMAFLPVLLRNAGGGGPFPFTEVVTSYTERCLWESLPYLEALMTSALSNRDNPVGALSKLISAPSQELFSLLPACLKA